LHIHHFNLFNEVFSREIMLKMLSINYMRFISHVTMYFAPETPGLLHGDSGVLTPETLGQGPETPGQVFGAVFREVSLFSDMGAETLPGIFG
jgi:hypothetical protein